MTKLLIVQQGHYGRTTGKTGTEGEQAMAHDVALWVQRMAPQGWAVRLIAADVPDALYRGGNAFVAIHADGSTNHLAAGASVGYRGERSATLAAAWKLAYKRAGWPYGFKADNYTLNEHHYYGTGKAEAEGTYPAIIIEVGFMTNTRERAWIDAHHADIARSIWMAVDPAAFAIGGRFEVIVDKTLMYAGPSIRTKPVMVLRKGNQVKQLSPTSSGGWFKARRYFRTGYVYAHYFKKL